MPKTVDHDARREEILAAAFDGVTLQATLHPTQMTPAAQRRLLRNKVSGLAAAR